MDAHPAIRVEVARVLAESTEHDVANDDRIDLDAVDMTGAEYERGDEVASAARPDDQGPEPGGRGLAAEDDVQWIEPALPRLSTCNAENVIDSKIIGAATRYNDTPDDSIAVSSWCRVMRTIVNPAAKSGIIPDTC